VAQEFAPVWTAYQRDSTGELPQFSFAKAQRRVTCYYFYVVDEQFGPGFVKICSYFPYPIKVWLNGHEWAKRQAAAAGIAFTELSNGFADCADPVALQALCDTLGPTQIQSCCNRWLDRLPTPLHGVGEVAGYWWQFSMRQIETSRTIVFDAPRHARAFFEALVADNLDVGRPDTVELIFSGRREAQRGRKPAVPETFKTKVVTRGVDVTVNAFYKHSRIKQYLKDGRALRIEVFYTKVHNRVLIPLTAADQPPAPLPLTVSRVSWNFGDDPCELYAAAPTVSARAAVSGWACRYSAATSWGICL
jgi:hypothetical protein